MMSRKNKSLINSLAADKSADHNNKIKNGSSSSSNKKRSVQNPTEDESSAHTPKRNRTESIVQSDLLSQSISNDNQAYSTPPRGPIIASTTSYFNKNLPVQDQPYDSSRKRQSRVSPNQKFPPFRLWIDDTNGHLSTELSIIREINKSTRLDFTYGRFAKSNDGRTYFLLFANSVSQFEFLLKKENWPKTINNLTYTFDLPNKTPASYSLVIQNVPPQWDAQSFGVELKRQYPSIIRTARLFRSGGIPLAKVRIDFSSHDVIADLLKAKRLLVDDSNIAYPIVPYVPPTKILRCYTCQAFDDHVSAYCPFKDDPICFRCSQHHPYNPKCENQIKCVHCDGNHMAGNPNCPVKLAKRKEKNLLQQSSHTSKSSSSSSTANMSNTTINAKSNSSSWVTIRDDNSSGVAVPSSINSTNQFASISNSASNNLCSNNIISMLDKINCTMLDIKSQQEIIKNKLEQWEDKIKINQVEIHRTQRCIRDVLIPIVHDTIKSLMTDLELPNNQNLSVMLRKLEDCSADITRHFLSHDYSINNINPLALNSSTSIITSEIDHES